MVRAASKTDLLRQGFFRLWGLCLMARSVVHAYLVKELEKSIEERGEKLLDVEGRRVS